jgi:deoxyribodipyrimidine photo-lyase
VSELSPYITHGFVDLVEVVTDVSARHPLGAQSRFMSELGWREFFRHVWWHRGDLIFNSMHAGPLPDDAYGRDLPLDIREARTGVPAIDTAVRMLYATGYLHNHARLWLASYVVHLRRVHWKVGADWLYAHLLDGDLASNHLSWQWVAGTFSQKPYLFNADNVARFAPERWRSGGSVVDASYEALEAIARGAPLPPGQPLLLGVTEPSLLSVPPVDIDAQPASRDQVVDRDIWLVHPWALRDPPGDLPGDVLCVAIFTKEFHERWPWSEARWSFVSRRMRELSTLCWHDRAAAITNALKGARSVRSVDDAHLDTGIRVSTVMNRPRHLFAKVPKYRPSFSQWWRETSAQI